jgi:hypothetical protein
MDFEYGDTVSFDAWDCKDVVGSVQGIRGRLPFRIYLVNAGSSRNYLIPERDLHEPTGTGGHPSELP